MRGLINYCLLALLAIACLPERRESLPELPGLAPFLQQETDKVEAIIQNMSLEEKLGQLIILALDRQPDSKLYQRVRKGRVGGVALSGLTIEGFLSLQDSLKRAAPSPLFSTAFGGALLNNQFSDAVPLPVMDALQAISSDSIKQKLNLAFLQQAESLGLNLAPALYLSHLEQQSSLSENNLKQYVKDITWLSRRHMLSIADGFAALPLLHPGRDSLRDSLFVDFQHLVKAGLSGFWIHPSVYESSELEPEAINRFFRNGLQFDGLLLAHLKTDNQIDEILDSGVDLIVAHNSPDFVMNYLLAIYRSGELDEQELHAKLRRILLAKQWIRHPVPYQEAKAPLSRGPIRSLPASMLTGQSEGSLEDAGTAQKLASYFNDSRWLYWQRRLQEETLVVASNPDSLLPFRQLGHRNFRAFHLGDGDPHAFDEAFRKYAALGSWKGSTWQGFSRHLATMAGAEHLVLILHDYALDSLQAASLVSLAHRRPITLINFKRLENLALLDTSLAVVHSFEEGKLMQELVAQALFGGIPTSGKLPYKINRFFEKGQGRALPQLRLRFGIPQQKGIAPEKLVGIDAIVETAIEDGVFPGCQVLAVKDGTVIYNKTMGYHTYSKKDPVRKTDLYDLASLTKVVSTTLASMRLYEERSISLNTRLRKLMALPRNSGLRNLTVKKLMTHQSGLQPHMPIVPYLLESDMENTDCSRYFCYHPSDTFSIQVAKDFYFKKQDYLQVFEDIHRLSPRNKYRYSDVNFIVLQQLVEEKAGAPLDALTTASFYRPLGLQRTVFHPLQYWHSSEIVPTQYDRRWRHQLIHGYVHDETAALMGGVAGNAGLFSTAEDLAVLFQMLLNEGTYGGERYFDNKTVRYFTSARHGNHRGLGFDKPDQESIKNGKFPEEVSKATFGHTGFTGTCAWADPEHGLTYILLSNRIYPNIKNRKLFKKRVRERIHQVIYDALDTYVPTMPEI